MDCGGSQVIEVRRLVGVDLSNAIDALADLRIQVFKEFPYLYDGTKAYEKNYLDVYLKSSRAAMIAAFDGSKIIGAASALPLLDENDYIKEPFIKAGFDLNRIFYFGESVLLKQYRGHGLGHRFFDAREEVALSFNQYNITCFCAVDRPSDHSQRPADYQPLNNFWQKRGYKKYEQLKSTFSWKEIGEQRESPKSMSYWMKEW